MRAVVQLAAALSLLTFVEPSCKKNTASVEGDAGASGPPVVFVGRCVNETAGTPWQSIYFFPKNSEMFLYLGKTGAERVPISVTEQTPRSVSFTFRWSEENELPSTHTAKVTAVGNKWSFDFDTLKDSLCHPVPSAEFYKMLPDLGIAAGTWQDKQMHFSLVVAADAQAFVLIEKGTNTTVSYRVLEQSGTSTLLASYGPQTPGDGDDEPWAVTRLTHAGDTLVHELADQTLHYRLVAAAPMLK